MANTNRPHGFHPVSYLNGAPWNGQARTYYIPAEDGDAYFAGDPVKTQAGASAGRAAGQMSVGVARAAKAAGTDVVRGVAIAFGANPADPSASSIPAVKRSSYLVAVVDDPLVLFEVQGDNTGTLEATVIGKFASFNVATPDSAGFSASTLNTASIDSDSGLPLRILGLASGTFGPYCRFLVVWNLHELQGGTTTEAVVGDQAANTVFAGPESGADDAPEFRELVLEDLPSEVQILVTSPVAATPGGRVAADGTLLASTGLVGAARVGLGDYTATIDGTAQTIGGFIQMWPVATPSGVSGDGGDGVSPFKEASGFEAAVTDTIDETLFFYSPLHNKVYALGADSDDIWIHDIADWDAAAVQKDSTINMQLAGPRSGCMDYDGDIIWVSGSYSADNVMAYTISTDTWTQFDIPSLGDSYRSIIGSRDGHVVVQTNSTTLSYEPDFGTGLMGASVQDWSTVFYNSVSSVLTWDAAGYGWTWFGASPGQLFVVKPDVATIDNHELPFEIGSDGTTVQLNTVNGPLAYDSRRNALLVSLTSGSGLVPSGIFRYSDWIAGADNSGVWERLTADTGWTSLAYDADTDIIIGVGFATNTVERFVAQTGEKIDSVYVPDFASTYSVGQGRHSFYLNGSHYLLSAKSGTEYILRIDYAGDNVTLVGSGDSFVSSVLVAQTSVINDTTAGIQIYRSLDPPVRADAQFSVHIGFK